MSEPRLETNLWRASRPLGLSVEQAEEIDRRCDRFEQAWRSGGCPRHEDHLGDGDGTFHAILRAELLDIELEWRRRLEQAPASSLARSHGVLESIAVGLGVVPRVLLRDTDGGPESPLHRPSPARDPNPGLRYRVDGEIARGGMGAILKGRDPDLGRDVALKVLRDEFRDDGDMIRRFVEEAQIGGQLQHPGIVPIYEMGLFGDDRPFFSMKLVKGDTLAKLLSGRKDPMEGLPRFLAIFESIAQTMAYSHARGVIHRDLKPSNVMVGAFGEVQVMDWGLAKVLARGGLADDAAAGKVPQDDTVIATARSGSGDSDLSQAGSVLGTPSYMSPEQARGEIDRVDERADVFALGSILAEILTGRPAFIGRHGGEIQRKAAVGDLGEILARLDSSGLNAGLLDLAKDCLAREPEDRPKSAGAVAERIGAYLAGVQERLRRAELRSVEERGRRRLTTVVAAALILLGLLGGAGYTWVERQKSDRLARTTRGVDDALADAARLRGEAQSASPSDTGRWSAALSAAKRAEGLLDQGEADPALTGRVDALMAGLETERAASFEKARQIEVDRVLLDDLESVRGNRVAHRDPKRSDAEYAEVFRKAGLDLDATVLEEAGKWLASRTDPIELAGYLDDWAFVRRGLGRPEADWRRLVAAARGGDPDPWRDALRAKLGINDAGAIAESRRLADDPRLEDQPAPGLLLLARQLKFGCGDGVRAAQVLRRAVRRYPGDFRVHFELAQAPGVLDGSSDALFPYPEEASRHLTAALGIRPGSVSTRVVLSFAWIASRKVDEAVAECREAVRLGPDDALAHTYLGNALRWQGDFDEAEAECREAIRLDPNFPGGHNILGTLLNGKAKYDEAVFEYREALRLGHADPGVSLGLASALQRRGDYAEALVMINKVRGMGPNLVPDRWHSAEWVAQVERMAAKPGRYRALFRGEERPGELSERMDLALVCFETKRFADSARFWAETFADDPAIGESRRPQHRYNAACSAALAAAGQGKDDPPPDEKARAWLRAQALDWLKLELAAWAKVLEEGTPQARSTVAFNLGHWKQDADLAALRDPAGLAALPEAERRPWQAHWGDVEALRKRAEAKVP